VPGQLRQGFDGDDGRTGRDRRPGGGRDQVQAPPVRLDGTGRVAGPLPPKTVWLAPPNAAPISAPLPACKRINIIKNMQIKKYKFALICKVIMCRYMYDKQLYADICKQKHVETCRNMHLKICINMKMCADICREIHAGTCTYIQAIKMQADSGRSQLLPSVGIDRVFFP
jgi:hypothetical protein